MPIIDKFYIKKETLEYIYNIDLTHNVPRIAPLVEPIPLEPYQKKALEYMLNKDRFCIFLGPGTGKTLIAISWILSVKPKNALIVTPKKVIDQYKKECEKYITETDITVINYEKLQKNHAVYNQRWDVVMFDESQYLKDFMSLTNRTVRELLEADYIYMFSGTPQDHCRYEIMSQLAVLDTRFLPLKTDFINRYFDVDEYYQPTNKEYRPKELTSMIEDVSYMADTEELLSLPESEFHEHEYEIHPLYNVLAKDRIITKDDMPELFDDENILADTPGVLLIRLLQITSGIFKTSENRIIKLPTDKIRALKDCIKTHNIKRALIYTWFQEEQEDIKEALNKYDCVCVNGKTKEKDSNRIIEEFKKGKHNFLIIQAKCGGAGLDFKEGVENIIFYTLPTSLITYTQCIYRIRRARIKHTCHYHYLLSRNGVDRKILRILNKKKSFNARVFKNLM